MIIHAVIIGKKVSLVHVFIWNSLIIPAVTIVKMKLCLVGVFYLGFYNKILLLKL